MHQGSQTNKSDASFSKARSSRRHLENKIIALQDMAHKIHQDSNECPIAREVELEKTCEELSSALEHWNASERQFEEARRSYLAKIEASNRELQDFAFVASHDLREPLRKIISFAERLKSRYGRSLDAEGIQYIERLAKSAERMESLVQGLLGYSQITTKAELFCEVDLNEVVLEVLEDLHVSIESTGATVEVENLPVVEADWNQMRQLFQNLISNALKYRREESLHVKVYARPWDDDDNDDDNKDKSSHGCGGYEIAVEDNGIGFPQKHAERIFGLFQRLRQKNVPEGTGMGLAICKRIVERHHGRIKARGAPGKGSIFIIELPVKQCGRG